MTDNVLLVGYGGVGLLFSYVLQQSKRVHLTVVARSNYEAADRGITIDSNVYGKIPGFKPDRVVSSVAEAADRAYRLVLVVTKALPDVLPTSKMLDALLSSSYSHPQPTYVLLQNGLGIEKDLYEKLAQRGDPVQPQLITTAVWIIANLKGDTVHHRTEKPRIAMGTYHTDGRSPTEAETSNMTALKDLIEAGGGVASIAGNVQATKFGKNIWNVTYNLFTSLSGGRIGFIFATPDLNSQVKPVVMQISEEALAVGRALGYTEKEIPSSIPVDCFNYVVRSFSDPHDTSHETSTFLDVEAGRPFEVEAIIGEVVRSAHRLGVDVPMLDVMYALLFVMQAKNVKATQQL